VIRTESDFNNLVPGQQFRCSCCGGRWWEIISTSLIAGSRVVQMCYLPTGVLRLFRWSQSTQAVIDEEDRICGQFGSASSLRLVSEGKEI